MAEEYKPFQKYECKLCGSVITNEKDSPVKCVCGNTDLVLLAKQYTDEEIENTVKEYRETYFKIIETLDYWLDIPESYRKIIALWVVGTYLHKEFNSYPFLFFNAMRGSGKTRTLNIIKNLAWNGVITNNPTEAVIFRSAGKRTLIVDENESIVNKEKSTLRELLNAAYKKGSIVERMKKVKGKEGEEQVMEAFDLYGPIAMANISGMEEVLGDRCISVVLEKSSDPGKTKLIEDFEENPLFLEIKRTFEKNQCSLCSVVSLKNIKPKWNKYVKLNYTNYTTTHTTHTTLTTQEEENEVSEQELGLFNKIKELDIDGRNLELFFPILSIGSILGDDIIEEILNIIKTLVNTKKKNEYSDSPDIAVYEFVGKKDPLQFYPLSDLLAEFKHFFVADDGDRDWLNAKWFGRALRRLNLVVDDRRESKGMKVILDINKAKDKSQMFGGERDENP